MYENWIGVKSVVLHVGSAEYDVYSTEIDGSSVDGKMSVFFWQILGEMLDSGGGGAKPYPWRS